MNANLVIGLFWLLFFLIGLYVKEYTLWLDYGWLLVSGLYLGTYLYQRHYGYFTVDNDLLKLNDPRNKHINLNEVLRFKYFAGDYILESESKKLRINTHLLDPQDVLQLKTKLSEYGLQPGSNRKVQVGSR